MVVRIQRDIVFRHALIGYNKGFGPAHNIPLRLDAYLPACPPGTKSPALVLAQRGVFHRGSKEADAFSAGRGTSTSIAEYCQRFAGLGFPSFSVQYRLAQMDPEPSRQPVLTRPNEVPMSRVIELRAQINLPPIEPVEMARFMEAAFEDVAEAVRFLKEHGSEYNVDTERIVLGGFSAGGRCASYAAYGKNVGVAGVVSISGPLMPADAAAYLKSKAASPPPPLLMFSGEHDLDYVSTFMPEVERQFRAAGRQVEWAVVPDANHFYSAESRTQDGRTVFEIFRDNVNIWSGGPR